MARTADQSIAGPRIGLHQDHDAKPSVHLTMLRKSTPDPGQEVGSMLTACWRDFHQGEGFG